MSDWRKYRPKCESCLAMESMTVEVSAWAARLDGHTEEREVVVCTTVGIGHRFVATTDELTFYGRTSPARTACLHYINAETLEDLREYLRRVKAEAAEGAPYRGTE